MVSERPALAAARHNVREATRARLVVCAAHLVRDETRRASVKHRIDSGDYGLHRQLLRNWKGKRAKYTRLPVDLGDALPHT